MKSMTGFGSASAPIARAAGAVAVEVRSVNQRFLDVKMQLPRELQPHEAELRASVEASVSRGRVDVAVHRNAGRTGKPVVEIDERLARAHVEAWRGLARRLQLSGTVDLAFLQGRGELLRVTEEKAPLTAELRAVQRALALALREHDRARRREGKALERDLRGRVTALAEITRGMAERARAGAVEARRRLEERMRELLDGRVDEARLAQEAAFQVERADVSEEIVRLGSHLDGLRKLLAARDPTGRRIEFLLQEVGREVNTISSKSNDLGLTELALAAKGEVEKLREQSQNVE